MENQNMVVGLLEGFPLEGVCKGCVLYKHNRAYLDYGKVWQA